MVPNEAAVAVAAVVIVTAVDAAVDAVAVVVFVVVVDEIDFGVYDVGVVDTAGVDADFACEAIGVAVDSVAVAVEAYCKNCQLKKILVVEMRSKDWLSKNWPKKAKSCC